MLFHSIEFLLLFILVFFIYWNIPPGKTQQKKLLIITASYLFYGWWDWRFLSLIIISTLTDYFVSLLIEKYKKQLIRKVLMIISLVINLGILAVFKYYNFFIESFTTGFGIFNYDPGWVTKNLIFPIGISFYTFQTLGYTIDVYRKRIHATKDFLAFVAFVSFFPQLVAGPIEKAKKLLPQMQNFKSFDSAIAREGLKLILWGSFKKIVIADNLGIYVTEIFNNYEQHSGIEIYLGILFFAFQIYCDFSGYSDMAVGLAKLLNINLSRNFRYPFFAIDPVSFWSKWHITLSAWFRDYVLNELGGIRVNKLRMAFNIFIIYALIGLWHGADWKFIVWGILNALVVLPLYQNKNFRRKLKYVDRNSLLPMPRQLMLIVITNVLIVIPVLFFRAESYSIAIEMITHAFYNPLSFDRFVWMPVIFAGMFLIPEWFRRKYQHPLVFTRTPRLVRWMIYSIIILMIIFTGVHTNEPFIYFQF